MCLENPSSALALEPQGSEKAAWLWNLLDSGSFPPLSLASPPLEVSKAGEGGVKNRVHCLIQSPLGAPPPGGGPQPVWDPGWGGGWGLEDRGEGAGGRAGEVPRGLACSPSLDAAGHPILASPCPTGSAAQGLPEGHTSAVPTPPPLRGLCCPQPKPALQTEAGELAVSTQD